jgi:DNA repair protein RadC
MPATHISKTARFIPVTVLREDPVPDQATDSPERCVEFWREVIAKQPDFEPDKETLVVVLCNSRLRPFAWHRISVGSLNETTAHPREIFRPIIAGPTHGFILMHNHPSGECSPSQADRNLTKRIAEGAELLQLRFIDHIIVPESSATPAGHPDYFSFRESGLL